MSKNLKQGAYFLHFLLNPSVAEHQIRYLLKKPNSSQLHILTEILHNIINKDREKNQKTYKTQNTETAVHPLTTRSHVV